jgi:hypothetical protein
MAHMVELIQTEERRGIGTDSDPLRICTQLWRRDGVLVAEYDPMANLMLFWPALLPPRPVPKGEG